VLRKFLIKYRRIYIMNEKEFGLIERDVVGKDVVIGLALTPEEKTGRLEVVTERYIREGYLQGVPFARLNLEAEEVLSDGGFEKLEKELEEDIFRKFLEEGLLLRFKGEEVLYLDKYHWQSAQFVARTREGYVGSVRIIIDDKEGTIPTFQLPTLADREIKINEECFEKVHTVPAELSQFAKVKHAPPTVAFGLLRIAAQYSRALGIKDWLATTDNQVVKMLNGFAFNFDLPKIGPSVRYLGSDSTPVYIDIEESIDNAARKESSKNMAAFLRGNDDVEGFEWYTGI